jgi:hypothetical protein
MLDDINSGPDDISCQPMEINLSSVAVGCDWVHSFFPSTAIVDTLIHLANYNLLRFFCVAVSAGPIYF